MTHYSRKKQLLERKAELQRENKAASEEYHGFDAMGLNLQEIRRIDEVLAQMKDDRKFLALDDAIAMLPDREVIHTFRGSLCLIGCDWTRSSVVALMRKHPAEIELSSDIATAMGHGLCVTDDCGPLFVETKPLTREEKHEHRSSNPNP